MKFGKKGLFKPCFLQDFIDCASSDFLAFMSTNNKCFAGDRTIKD